MHNYYENENTEVWNNENVKNRFVQTVQIIAIFHCKVNNLPGNQVKEICEVISKDLCAIFRISLQPHSTFEAFRNAHQTSDNKLSSMLVHSLKDVLYPLNTPIFNCLTKHPRFDELCDNIQSWRKAQELADELMPTILCQR